MLGLILGTRVSQALLAGGTPSFQTVKPADCPPRRLLWYFSIQPKRPFKIPIPSSEWYIIRSGKNCLWGKRVKVRHLTQLQPTFLRHSNLVRLYWSRDFHMMGIQFPTTISKNFASSPCTPAGSDEPEPPQLTCVISPAADLMDFEN